MTIRQALSSLFSGLAVTKSHLGKAGRKDAPVGIKHKDYFSSHEGAVTIQYPTEQIPVPDHGRYQLHLEEEDCIVCDKCARICPVDCIDIVGIKAQTDLGYTSDGSKKRIELGKFDIDMAKCCYCGLCTTVCPTECLTMIPEYDYSTYDRNELIFEFSSMSEEEMHQKQTAAAAAKSPPAASSRKKPSLKARPKLVPKKKEDSN